MRGAGLGARGSRRLLRVSDRSPGAWTQVCAGGQLERERVGGQSAWVGALLGAAVEWMRWLVGCGLCAME